MEAKSNAFGGGEDYSNKIDWKVVVDECNSTKVNYHSKLLTSGSKRFSILDLGNDTLLRTVDVQARIFDDLSEVREYLINFVKDGGDERLFIFSDVDSASFILGHALELQQIVEKGMVLQGYESIKNISDQELLLRETLSLGRNVERNELYAELRGRFKLTREISNISVENRIIKADIIDIFEDFREETTEVSINKFSEEILTEEVEVCHFVSERWRNNVIEFHPGCENSRILLTIMGPKFVRNVTNLVHAYSKMDRTVVREYMKRVIV